jgi:glycosyltransferase involved in cell wall biosynthesis
VPADALPRTLNQSMPTLLTINNYFYYRGGAETVFLEHNRIFEALGWNVVPFAMKHPRNLASEWSKYFIDEIEFGEQYSVAEQLKRVPKVIYSVEARHNLARLLDRAQPDVCHAHNIYHHISPSILGLLKRRGIPTVMTLHDLKIACPAYNMLANDGICERCRGGRFYNVVAHRCIKRSTALSAVVMLEALLHRMLGSYSRCVSRFAVPSRFYIEKLSEWGMPAELFRHVPNFVDVDSYTPQFEPGSIFVYFGRISREKGLATLIRAVAAVGCELAVIGTGPDLEAMRNLAVEIEAKVFFPGFLRGAELHDAVRSARAVVLPSEWYENAPMSVLEAYALGKPVIGARIGGIPELVRENETGMCFTSSDESSLGAVLRDMIRRPDAELQQMGRNARSWVAAEFTAEIYRERILHLYRELGVNTSYEAPATQERSRGSRT